MRILTLLFLSFSQLTFASFDMNDNMQASYHHIINLDFEAADLCLLKEESKNPRNGFILLHRNYIDFLTILISEDVRYFKSHEHLKDLRIGLIEKNDRDSPYYLYCKAELNIQWAVSRLKFGDYITSSYELVKAYMLLKENKKRFPDFLLNNKGLGLLHAFLGIIPENFHWILRLTGVENAGVLRGINELDSVLNDNRFLMYEEEILFLLSFLNINLTNNDILCNKYLDRIGDRYRDNILLNFAAARLSHNLFKNDDCIHILNNRPNNPKLFRFHYLDYLLAMSYLYNLDLDSAKSRFQFFLINFKGVNYIKSANHKLAWIAFLQDDKVMKNQYFLKVISDGSSLVDEDKVALKEAKQGFISDISLLRARLFFDGGYYALALSELNQIKSPDSLSFQINKIEYWYRFARVYSKLKEDETLIIPYYQRSLDEGEEKSSYYAPMSALQLGFVYENKKEFQKAKKYFYKCLTMSGFDYQRGIHQKAKAGLERVSN